MTLNDLFDSNGRLQRRRLAGHLEAFKKKDDFFSNFPQAVREEFVRSNLCVAVQITSPISVICSNFKSPRLLAGESRQE